MPDVIWWSLQAVTVLAMAVSTGLAFAASGRIGRHTPYGTFLFVLAMGFWFLLGGIVTYVATRAIGAWHGAPGWGDPFTLIGWALLTVSFYLVLLRFPAPGAGRVRHRRVVTLVPLFAGLAVAALVIPRDLHYGAQGADSLVRAAYLLLDGIAVGAFALSFPLLQRVRRASLGRLYAFLGAALTIKTAGDLLFLFWPNGAPLPFPTTALYPVSGLLVVTGLVLHQRAVAKLDSGRILAQPGFSEGQLILRDTALHMRGLLGTMGERLVLESARRALEERGIAAEVQGGVVHARATPEAWTAAVAAARHRTVEVLGETGDEVFTRVQHAYGVSGVGPSHRARGI